MSRRQVVYHDGARSDVKSAVTWYQERSLKAAEDFIAELHQAADIIRKAPDRWPVGKNNTRRFLLLHFPFSIIYSEEKSSITVWAVAHASRRPDY
jgi:plasmid stabilization system protein ParE